MHHRSPRGASTLRRLFLLTASCGLAAVGWFLLGESESQSLAARGESQTAPRVDLFRQLGVPESRNTTSIPAIRRLDLAKNLSPWSAEHSRPGLLAETPPRPVLARVDGIDVTEDEVNGLAADALAELAERRHQLIVETTRGEVHRRLLEAEAERRGITPEELLDLEVDRPAREVGRKNGEFYATLIARLEQTYGVEYLIEPVPAGIEGLADASDDPPAIARLATR